MRSRISPVPVVIIGPYPPPMHGAALATISIANALEAAGEKVIRINVSGSSLNRALRVRLRRLPRIGRGILLLGKTLMRENPLVYISVAGGLGQFSDELFSVMTRLSGNSLVMHHHSYAYLNRRRLLAWILLRSAGASATHLVQCVDMRDRLARYGISPDQIKIFSNIFAIPARTSDLNPTRASVSTLGFLSNISAAKGIFEFLATISALRKRSIKIAAVIAGPFIDPTVEEQVRQILATLPEVRYIGPVNETQKAQFFSEVDVLLFPTKYVNEAEPLTIHEAMAHGVPIIAAARGCIANLIPPEAGMVVPAGEPFVDAALGQIVTWIKSPASYATASAASLRTFSYRKEQSGKLTDLFAAATH